VSYWISAEKAQVPKNAHEFSYMHVPKFQLFFKKVAEKQVHQLDLPIKKNRVFKKFCVIVEMCRETSQLLFNHLKM